MRYATYQLKTAERIDRLAQRLLGDINRWRELVEINALEHPYTATNPAPYIAQGLKVLGPGDTILYPGAALETPGPATAAQAEADAYGRDLKLDKSGNLVLQGGNNYALTFGLDNFSAALRRRLNTRRGNLPAHPETYGHQFRQYIGGLAALQQAQMVRAEAERTIRQDSRVGGVSLTVGIQDDVVSVSASVEPVLPNSNPALLEERVPQ